MSRSRFLFPRVAPRTRPRPEPSAKLPPLKVAIYQNGELQKVTTIPDPRNAFCEAMARNFGDMGMSARPVLEGGGQ